MWCRLSSRSRRPVTSSSPLTHSVQRWQPMYRRGSRGDQRHQRVADPELADVAAAQGATLVITHSLALPRQHHHRPQYSDIVTEIKAFLAERVQLAVDHGSRRAGS